MNPLEFDKSIYSSTETALAVYETILKMRQHFGNHESILVSVSGGSDSDCIVHLVCKYFPEYLHKCRFVWVDTGLEYAATRRHIQDLKTKYKIEIERIRGKSVVWAVKQHGVPILNKLKSKAIDYLQRGVPCGERLVNMDSKRFGFTENQKRLAYYCKNNGIKVSSKCCDISKKKPLYDYIKSHGIDLDVTGERKAEGGVRAARQKTCFAIHKDGLAKYMPLFWWSDETKADFKQAEKIRYSDCYEVYGMRRTGCVGCPFSLDIAQELQTMRRYEPQLYKACMHVFWQSYRLTDQFNARREKILPDEIQLFLADEAEGGEE